MRNFLKSLFLVIITALFCISPAAAQTQNFEAGKNTYLLNGKPFVVRAGELHYTRIPRPYWEHRIQMLKAMGMNTVCIYLFWNIHEQEQGVFDFSGQNDVAEFIRLIQKNGMYCIVRPGPYVCAEWDMGGLPWWLLKKKDLQVRRKSDTFFMERTRIYLNESAKILAPFQIQNGGPVIMVQVENEYGTWGNDGKYMEQIRDYIREAGYDKVSLVRCDWSSNFFRYNVEGVEKAINFGAGSNIDDQFRKFKELNPDAPLMCGEYWTGWFDQWGRAHETHDVNSFIGSLKDMMDRKISFSLYMAHGGTSFGQWAGANAPAYAPTTSSYDYNAPIDEAGNPTEKFYAIRNLLKNYLQEGEVLIDVPANPEKTIRVPEIKFKMTASLFDQLPAAKTTEHIQPMEFFDQGWGTILYRKQLPASTRKQQLIITDVHDWATVFVDGKPIATLDRRKGEKSVEIPALKKAARLDILVEGMGRVNYGEAIIDRKGITEKVTLVNGTSETNLTNWQVYNFPVDYNFQISHKFSRKKVKGPAWYKATFQLKETGYTYLDMSSWGKGMVWVNGHNMGRFWKIGPTQTLCVPGCYLKKGENEIVVFDIAGPANTVIEGLNRPILDKIVKDENEGKKARSLNLNGSNPVVVASLHNKNEWQTVSFDEPATGRYFCIEVLSAQDANDNAASLAEIELIDEDGNPLSALKWKVLFANSEETVKFANGADKLYDKQESVVWQTKFGDKNGFPHTVVIDLGKETKLTAVKVLNRLDKNQRGKVKDVRFYLQKQAFKIQ